MTILGPRVRYSGINYLDGLGSGQYQLQTNSRVCSVFLVFSEPVSIEADAATIRLHTNNVSLNGASAPGGVGAVPSFGLYQPFTRTNYWVLRPFDGDVDIGQDAQGTPFEGLFNSVRDGVYDILVDGSKVHAGDGRRGLDWSGTFWRFFGKVTPPLTQGESALVDDYYVALTSADNLVFRNSFGANEASTILYTGDQDIYPGYRRWLDYDGNGVINSLDNFVFETNFNRSLSWSQ